MNKKLFSYCFITTWHIDQPINKIWDELIKFDDWPKWWKSIKKVRLEQSSDTTDVGILHFTWKGILPYSLRFPITITNLDPMRRIEGIANGDLEGKGICDITSTKTQTTITYTWSVKTKKRWMNIVAPFTKPLFSWNHHMIMQQGAKGLAKHLNTLVTSK